MELMTDDVVFENTSGGRFEGQDCVRAVLARAFELKAVVRQVGGLCPEAGASAYERLSLVDAGR